ncbi:hypothetical protein [Mycobacterium parmense]|uniref:Uncharacterized protein n=2 Tax=Mycobacterium parmense TaxID=185642 RepID=A0A7I7YPB8_9MYCO|nr:hypothetical protein [Mycobacterium parmense]ORW58923.1 hypothetical protein AWC20_11390 [Mycobacterium parmense]BBZ43715.1 hypothetical protein MPRM_09960 [Mycobacterium parmense]
MLAEVAPDGLRLHLGRGIHHESGAPFRAPRHHHVFQQVRWCDSGRKNFAPGQYIETGDVAYFPKGAYYGPEVKDGAYSGWATQFGFGDQHQLGPDWEPFRRQARADLRARGTFTNGRYIPVDPVTGVRGEEMDGVEAIYAHTVRLKSQGRDTYVIPPEGYHAPIVMHPAAFAYFPLAPGVEIKRLGCFYDHPGENGDTRIAMVRLHEGGVFSLRADRNQIGMTTSNGLRINDGDRAYPVHTAYYSPIGETTDLRGSDGTELYVVELPRQD